MKITYIDGDDKRTALLLIALRHEQLSCTMIRTEKDIIDHFENQSPDLVIVGNQVGNRDAMTLCEAVRVRSNKAPILLLIDKDVDPSEMENHKKNKFDTITYFIQDQTWDTAEKQLPSECGWQIRALVLQMLHIEEDPETAMEWVSSYEELFDAIPPRLSDDDAGQAHASQSITTQSAATATFKAFTKAQRETIAGIYQTYKNLHASVPIPKPNENVSGLEWTIEQHNYKIAMLQRDLAIVLEANKQLEENIEALQEQLKQEEAVHRQARSQVLGSKQQKRLEQQRIQDLTQHAESLKMELTQTKLNLVECEKVLEKKEQIIKTLEQELEKFQAEFDDETERD